MTVSHPTPLSHSTCLDTDRDHRAGQGRTSRGDASLRMLLVLSGLSCLVLAFAARIPETMRRDA